jgi:hypothetical protein
MDRILLATLVLRAGGIGLRERPNMGGQMRIRRRQIAIVIVFVIVGSIGFIWLAGNQSVASGLKFLEVGTSHEKVLAKFGRPAKDWFSLQGIECFEVSDGIIMVEYDDNGKVESAHGLTCHWIDKLKWKLFGIPIEF